MSALHPSRSVSFFTFFCPVRLIACQCVCPSYHKMCDLFACRSYNFVCTFTDDHQVSGVDVTVSCSGVMQRAQVQEPGHDLVLRMHVTCMLVGR